MVPLGPSSPRRLPAASGGAGRVVTQQQYPGQGSMGSPGVPSFLHVPSGPAMRALGQAVRTALQGAI